MRILAAVAALALLFVLPAQAAVFTVDSTADTVDVVPGDGICADASGACTLHAAMMEVNALAGEDRIEVPAGDFVLPAAIPGNWLSGDVTLAGAGRGATTLTGDLLLQGPTTVTTRDYALVSLSLQGSVNQSSTPHGDPSIAITDCSVRGGAINVSEVTVVRSTLLQSRLRGYNVMVVDSVVSGNTQTNAAGIDGGWAVTLINSTVSGNDHGVWATRLKLVNSTVSNNHVGIWFCRIEMDNGTVQGNGPAPSGASGGLVTGGCPRGWSYGGEIRGSIISGNEPFDCALALPEMSVGYNIDSDGTCNLTDPTDLPNTDPILGALQDNGGPTLTHALLPGSPAINAIPLADCTYDDDGDPGTPEVLLTEDQRGVARPQGSGCDIGAYEVTACADGLDNDGDGLIDYPDDPGCFNPSYFTESPQCQDGIDNDGDGKMDYDAGLSANGFADPAGSDPYCAGTPWVNLESLPTCGLGAELALLLPPLMWMWRRRKLH